MSKNRMIALVLVLIVPLLLAACGGSNESATATPAPAAVVAATEAPTEVPAEVVATEVPVEEDAEAISTTETTTESAPAGAAATETVVRTFVVTPGNGSTAQYAVEEEFFGAPIPFVTAVGTTDQVDGSLVLAQSAEGVTLQDGGFTVNLQTLTSDQSRRDNAIRRDWLQSNTYPNAVFSNISVVNLPADVTEGADVNFQLSGDLTVREIALPVTWDVTARVENGTLTGTATTNVLMADYGFSAPSIGGMLKVTDGVTVTVNLVAQEQ